MTVGRGSVGTNKLRIGELAEKANVTKRTIDYYTRLGLLEAERSSSNYRLYAPSSIERLGQIEQWKESGKSLDEIKRLLLEKNKEDAKGIDVRQLRKKIKGLEQEITEVLVQLDHSEVKGHTSVKKQLSQEGLSLIRTLWQLLH